MIKFRDAQYCNLKLFLIFLVIYGHLIEPKIWNSEILMVQYRWIYLVHMPLFSFLSGLFINHQKHCRMQFLRIFPLYVFLQALAVLLGNGLVKVFTPWWIFWYLLSYSIWLCVSYLWFRFCKGKWGIAILLFSIIAGCLVGLIPYIGREFSLSRTIVFFPYFWAGVIIDPTFNWKKLRWIGFSSLVIVVTIMLCLGDEIPVTFLYQTSSYNDADGILLRLLCYLLAVLLGIFLLSFSSMKRLPFTKLGTNTMFPYLFHAPFVLLIREFDYPWYYNIVIAVTFLYITYKLTQWHNSLYGIKSTERRDNSWQLFNKSMKNKQDRFIDSYYP